MRGLSSLYKGLSGVAPTADDIEAVKKAGDTMTGALILSGSPTEPNQAATKSYVDSNIYPASTTNQGVSYLNNPITIANNATNPNTQMDIGAGIVDYDNGSGQLLCQAITKTLQSSGSWTAGTNQNGLDSGARANSTLYHIFQIVKNSDNTSDILYSLSRTSPTIPSGYTLVAWIGSFRTNASGNIDQNYLAKKTINGQIAFFKTSVFSSGSTIIPIDNTIPQNTEGDQYMSIDFIPLRSKSTLEIDVDTTLSFSNYGTITMALFQDSVANAICSKPAGFVPSANAMIGAFMRHILKSSSTNLTTFKFRAGNVNAGTTYFNGNGYVLYNNTLFSSITIKEII